MEEHTPLFASEQNIAKVQRTRGLSITSYITSSNTNLDQMSSSESRPSINLGGGKDKKFQVYPQIPMLWSNVRLLV